MPLLSKPAFGPRTAIIYITAGSLIDVWTAVWYFVYARDDHGAISRNTWFWLAGLFLSGLTLICIGFFLGRIGQAARKAELPPKEAQDQETTIQATAAAHPQPVMAGAVPGVGTAMAGVAPVSVNAMPAPAAQPQYVPGVTRT